MAFSWTTDISKSQPCLSVRTSHLRLLCHIIGAKNRKREKRWTCTSRMGWGGEDMWAMRRSWLGLILQSDLTKKQCNNSNFTLILFIVRCTSVRVSHLCVLKIKKKNKSETSERHWESCFLNGCFLWLSRQRRLASCSSRSFVFYNCWRKGRITR